MAMRITRSLLSWRSFNDKNIHSPLRHRARILLSGAAVLTLLFSAASSSFAGSATWKASPATGDWNTATNWNPATVPNGTGDTATFASSNITGVSLSQSTAVDGVVFNAGASAFTIDTGAGLLLGFFGVGITNNSGIRQNFVAAVDGPSKFGIIDFTNGATAGSLTAFTNKGSVVSGEAGGATEFLDNSTAGNSTFTNNGGAVSGAGGGRTQFAGNSTASNGAFPNNGGAVSGAFGGQTTFFNTATAGNGTFTNNGGAVSGAGGGLMQFFNWSAADKATLIANGGVGGGFGASIQFTFHSHGGKARVEVFGNGNLDISSHTAPGVGVGSIEGTGAVFLGANNLTVGSNRLSTIFSGVIQDGGTGGGTGGSLTKIDSGTLTLTKGNTYTGGTTLSAGTLSGGTRGGTLLVKNKTGSATGSGAVQVNAGILAGTGKIDGPVTIGTGSGRVAILLPGNSATKPGTLTINSALTFNSPSGYECVLNRSTPKAGEVTALGVTINSGVAFTFVDTGTGTLTTGTVFTVINNTSASPIAGTFSNLANNSTFTSNGTTFKASYTGGTGNDLTLTVQ